MSASEPGSPDLDGILTSRRMADAFGALNDPTRGVIDDALRLGETERNVIRQALRQSSHPLAGFARQLVDQWDDLAADDRVPGLLLFREITVGPKRRQSRDVARSRSPGLGR